MMRYAASTHPRRQQTSSTTSGSGIVIRPVSRRGGRKDPRRIQFDVRGAKRIRDDQGELVFKVGDEEIRWHKPGMAKFTTSTLALGVHTITATYNGSTSFSAVRLR